MCCLILSAGMPQGKRDRHGDCDLRCWLRATWCRRDAGGDGRRRDRWLGQRWLCRASRDRGRAARDRTGQPEAAATMASPRSRMSSRLASPAAARFEVFVERLADLEPLRDGAQHGRPMARAARHYRAEEIGCQCRGPVCWSKTAALAQGEPRHRRAGDSAVTSDARESATRTATRPRGPTSWSRWRQPVEVFFAVYLPAANADHRRRRTHLHSADQASPKCLAIMSPSPTPAPAFATRERLPDADELFVEWPDEAMAHLPLSAPPPSPC